LPWPGVADQQLLSMRDSVPRKGNRESGVMGDDLFLSLTHREAIVEARQQRDCDQTAGNDVPPSLGVVLICVVRDEHVLQVPPSRSLCFRVTTKPNNGTGRARELKTWFFLSSTFSDLCLVRHLVGPLARLRACSVLCVELCVRALGAL